MSTSFASFRGGMAARDRQTESEITRTDARMKAGWEATRAPHTVRTAQNENLLPARLTRDDADEVRRIEELPDVAQALGYRQPVGGKELAEYVEKKRQDARFVDRERWIARRFDLNAPEKAAWFNQIMPSFLERRKRYGESKLAMQKQLFDITLYGPQSEEDIDFLFAVDTGSIDLEELSRPIWHAANQPTTNATYVAGMFAQRPNFRTTHAAAGATQGYNMGHTIGGHSPNYLAAAGNIFPQLSVSGHTRQIGAHTLDL